jgi:hypothetical protein
MARFSFQVNLFLNVRVFIQALAWISFERPSITSNIDTQNTVERRGRSADRGQGCQMVYYQTKNNNLGNFWRFLQWKMLVHFMAIWSILRHFGIFYGNLDILCSFGMFLPVLVCCIKENLATLASRKKHGLRTDYADGLRKRFKVHPFT